MKNFTKIAVLVLVSIGSIVAHAGPTTNNVDHMLQEKMDCYRAHHKIMDKPSLQTLDACWKAHHQLMK